MKHTKLVTQLRQKAQDDTGLTGKGFTNALIESAITFMSIKGHGSV